MDPNSAIGSLLKPYYFWDVDISALDIENNQRLIIERIMSFGSIREIKTLIELYGRAVVIDTCLRIPYFDPKTLNFISKLFSIPKEKFRCYPDSPSTIRHWNS
jgi:hypothetical protein